MSGRPHIGLFGGTFDPVHLGHLHLASLARADLALDEVRFLPCRISPHKTGPADASGADRLEMLRLATAGLTWAVVDPFDLEKQGPSFSYQTATEMASRYPDARLFWIMGGDQWDALPTWENPRVIAGLVEFAVLARGSTPEPREGYRLHVIQGDHPASATEIRKAACEPAHHWLHPDVARHIRGRGLYQR